MTLLVCMVMNSAEDENRKLHQVIGQLRSLRKTQTGEEQSAQQEVLHLRALCQDLTRDNERLTAALSENEALAALVPDLQTESNQLHKDKAHLEQALLEAKRYLATKEKEFFDQKMALEIARSEQLISLQELDYRSQEISNLKDAIGGIEQDYKHQLQLAKSQIHELQSSKESLERLLAQLKEENSKVAYQDLEKRYLQCKQDLDDQELIRRQLEMEFNKEKKKMQQTLENAVRQLQNSSQDVIDRSLVANLIVSYFQRNK